MTRSSFHGAVMMVVMMMRVVMVVMRVGPAGVMGFFNPRVHHCALLRRLDGWGSGQGSALTDARKAKSRDQNRAGDEPELLFHAHVFLQ
jgi:hypothetical protein